MGRPRSSKSSVARFLDQVSFPILLIDDRRLISYCNQACIAWMGVDSEDELVGQRCDYHTDQSKNGSLVAGLCPPVEAFYGAHLRAPVFNSKREEISAQFLPLTAESNQTIGVLILADGRETDQTSNSRTSESSDLHAGISAIRREFKASFAIDRIAGTSATAQRVRNQVQLACQGRPHVTVFGPKGSGREHLLRTIYYSYAEASSHPLVPLTCELFDAELLQTTVESYIRSCADLETDAIGALLLLEADQLPIDAQAELVGFLSIPEFQIQMLATSRRSLLDMAKDGDFRTDLAYLLSVLQIELPALHDRPEDIEQLAQARLEANNLRGEKQISGFSKESLEQISEYSWPGNVDELFELVDQAHRQCDQTFIEPKHLPETIFLARQAAETNVSAVESIQMDAFLESIEIELIQRALKQSRGNKSKAAKLLGINRGRMLRRLDHFGLADSSDE